MRSVSENFLRQQRLLQSGGLWKRVYLAKGGTVHEITPYLRKDGLGEVTHQVEKELNEFVAEDVTMICINDDFFFNAAGTGLFDDLSEEVVCTVDLGLEFANDTVRYFQGWLDPESVKRLDRKVIQFRAKGYLTKHELYNAEDIKDPLTDDWYQQAPVSFLVDKLFEQAEIPQAGREIYVEPVPTEERVFSYYNIYDSDQACHAIVQVPSGDPDVEIYYAGLGTKLLRIEDRDYYLAVYEITTLPAQPHDFHWIDKLWYENGYIWLVEGYGWLSELFRNAIAIWRIKVQDPPHLDIKRFGLSYYCPPEGFVMDYPKLYFTQSNIPEGWLRMGYFDCSTGTFHPVGSALNGKKADSAAELDGANRYFLRVIDVQSNQTTWGYFNVISGAFTNMGVGPKKGLYSMEYHPTDDGSARIYFSMQKNTVHYCLNLTNLSFEQVDCNWIGSLQYDPLTQELYYWPSRFVSQHGSIYKLRNRVSTMLPDQLLSGYACHHPPMSISSEGFFWGLAHDSATPGSVTKYLPFIYQDSYIPYVHVADFSDWSNREALQKLAEAFKCIVVRSGKSQALFSFRGRHSDTLSLDEDLYFAAPALKTAIWGHMYDGVVIKTDGQEFTAGETGYGKDVLTIDNRLIPPTLAPELAQHLFQFFGAQRRWLELEGVFLAQLELMDRLEIAYQDNVIPASIHKLRHSDQDKRVKICALEDL